MKVAIALCALMLTTAPAAAQKLKMEDIMKPYEAKERPDYVPPQPPPTANSAEKKGAREVKTPKPRREGARARLIHGDPFGCDTLEDMKNVTRGKIAGRPDVEKYWWDHGGCIKFRRNEVVVLVEFSESYACVRATFESADTKCLWHNGLLLDVLD